MRLSAVSLVALVTASVVAAAPLARIAVSSPAFAPGGAIPSRCSAYGANRSPPLRWRAVAGAKSYALIMDDPDAHGSKPFVHWIMWNIPPTATSLSEAAARGVSGENGAGKRGYFGPHPPSGVHHYHLRLFALKTALSLAPGADRAALDRAMSGHVLGEGELIGTYAAPAR